MAREPAFYDLRIAKALLDYVLANYSLRTTDRKIYRALQSLESQQDGPCKDVVQNHRTIARCAKVSLKTVGVALKRLAALGLIEYTPGSTTYADHLASRIRRKTIKEIETEMRATQPEHRLAAIMNKRTIPYGEDTVQPSWNAGKTNRLYASSPNIQGNKKHRAELLAAGCKPEQVLFELDFKAAEPSVIAQRLGLDRDGYEIIAEAEGIDRDEVKNHFNAVAYSRSTAVAKAAKEGWTSPRSVAFFQAVDGLRKQLRRPEGKPVRSVQTATGTTIEIKLGNKAFPGTLLSYYAQGSISDFINTAALEIIALEKSKGWRFVIPCHDSVYVIARPEQAEELREIVLAATRKSTLNMVLNIKDTRDPKCNPREW